MCKITCPTFIYWEIALCKDLDRMPALRGNGPKASPGSVGYWLPELREITNQSKSVSSLGKGNIIIPDP